MGTAWNSHCEIDFSVLSVNFQLYLAVDILFDKNELLFFIELKQLKVGDEVLDMVVALNFDKVPYYENMHLFLLNTDLYMGWDET